MKANENYMKVSARLKNGLNLNEVTVQTDDDSKALIIPSKTTGPGSSVNGGELLMLAIATCFCNDIYREAAKRGIKIHQVEVDASGEFAAEGEPGSNFQYKAEVRSDATAGEIRELLNYVNEIAEIHQTLRKGITVKLVH